MGESTLDCSPSPFWVDFYMNSENRELRIAIQDAFER